MPATFFGPTPCSKGTKHKIRAWQVDTVATTDVAKKPWHYEKRDCSGKKWEKQTRNLNKYLFQKIDFRNL